MAKWAAVLRSDADAASDWVMYRDIVREADELLGSEAITKCRAVTNKAKDVPCIVNRRVYKVWLDAVYAKTPVLRGFAAKDHENLRASFRELDERLGTALRSAVRKTRFQLYPGSTPSYEMSVLKNQLSKKRKQMPVRRLLEKAPAVIQKFKPCFLMSPLTVSQFLPLGFDSSDTLTFDVVIFDEASQVFPEDAIPAILHGEQVVLAGDPKQLPPTKFWRTHLEDSEQAYYDNEEEVQQDSLEDRESILDVGIGFSGRLFRESYLDIHYRSRHEDLIRFSNRHFYQDHLLTFPSPSPHDSNGWQGVHDHFLPDGVFDAGGSRTNRVEAEKVVELVFDHMRTRGMSKSLGVAAFSRSQADLIDRLITESRLLESYLDDAFSGRDTSEPFFVKNLENVQGDERDRIIISVGYGPTVVGGATPNRFGPLNSENGERRLNVLVTRARERMDVVYSIKPADIHSETTGARLLRRFLEYSSNPGANLAESPTTSLATPTGEELNDFEKAVKSALEARGHRVEGQIGSAGYRIDLAIVSDDGERYDLGVECDGVTYHSAPAARDRDWLRQSVLEGLGWTIHRVWSTSWVRNPAAEIERIESALSYARAQKSVETIENLGGSREDKDTALVEELVLTPDPQSLEHYIKADLLHFATVGQLRYETVERLMKMVVQVVAAEGPVHKEVVFDRIRKQYARVNKEYRKRVEWAVGKAVKERQIRSNGNILYKSAEQLARPPRKLGSRRLEFVPPSELEQIVVHVAGDFLGPKDKLIVEVARLLGFSHTGPRIKETVGRQIEKSRRAGKLELSFGTIRPS